MVGSFCVGKINYARNVMTINHARKVVETPFIRKYNNHNFKVNLESRNDMVCGPPTAAWDTNTFY
jgi:hypothetical protein